MMLLTFPEVFEHAFLSDPYSLSEVQCLNLSVLDEPVDRGPCKAQPKRQVSRTPEPGY